MVSSVLLDESAWSVCAASIDERVGCERSFSTLLALEDEQLAGLVLRPVAE
jgi:hypothetical protein